MIKATEIFVDSMSEQAAAAAARETIGFEEVFSLHHRTVYRAARSVVRDAALAEDVTQEVFLKYYHHRDSITDEEMLRPWLIRVALNIAKNTVRGKVRANTRDENYVKQSEIQKALGKIREPLRSCLILKQQGLSYREIANALEIKETSIGTYVARARQEFLRFYGRKGGEEL